MTESSTPEPVVPEAGLLRRPESKTFFRVSKYFLAKAAALLLTVAVGLYLTILVINLGGAVDAIFRSDITEALSGRIHAGWLRDVPLEERNQILAETQWQMEEARGLHEPFLLRSVRWLGNAMRLDLGETWTTYFITSGVSGSVETLVLEHLPYTLTVVGVANILLFFFSVFVALYLSRKSGSLLDRLVIFFSPLTSAPSWIYGIILVLIFAGQLRLLPYPRSLSIQDIEYTLPTVAMIAKMAILPVLAIFLSAFFQGIYAWRTFFLIYSEEDYVDLARAKGLAPRIIERRYILRPTLPYVITSFAMLMISLWQSSIALEWFFKWPGVGTLFLSAIGRYNTQLALGVVTVFAYLLAITVLLLDVIYAIVDPRVRIEANTPSMRLETKHRWTARKEQKPGVQRGAIRSGTEPRGTRTRGPGLLFSLRHGWQSVRPVLRELVRKPAGLAGLIIVLVMIIVSLYTIIAIPSSEAIRLWLSQEGEGSRTNWYTNPSAARPVWFNLFRREKLPSTILLDNRQGTGTKESRAVTDEMTQIDIWFTFDYNYSILPQDMFLYIDDQYIEKRPFVQLTWFTPDGREIDLGGLMLESAAENYYLSSDPHLIHQLGGNNVIEGLFGNPEDPATALPGTYRMHLSGFVFEENSDIDAQLIVYGQVYGLAGTDYNRRDLMLPLLWGMPVALAFGLLGALATSLLAMILAAAGAWFGGWIDGLIQRICEVNMILPSLPIAILVFMMYSKTIWAILGVIILLSIFGNSLKNYRAVFLQVKEMPYIEAARSYGAGNWRIIRSYLVPKILPIMIPQLVTMVPAYVFYEATLAFLRVSDPYLPTWGKVIYDALDNNALQVHPAWLLGPIFVLLLLAGGFALLGMSLDRVLNPRLREK